MIKMPANHAGGETIELRREVVLLEGAFGQSDDNIHNHQ
jgi:hypothetical protein